MKVVIAGAGISGLATAYALLERVPELDVSVFESENVPGGKIRTERTSEGFLCEWGVNAFLDNKPKTLELAGRLGLEPLRSYDASRKRYIYSEGVLHRLPESPPSFFLSNFLSLRGRLRILGEMFTPRGTEPDETLAEFAVRRLGREAFEKMIDPMASGVYAGDAHALSLKSCFPRIYEIEQEYGSLIRGLITLQKKARKDGKTDKPSAGPGGKLTSFAEGMGSLVSALCESLGNRVHTGQRVTRVAPEGRTWAVELSGGGVIHADAVVLAVPAYAGREILSGVSPIIGGILDRIPYPSLAICSLGYRKEKISHPLDGFGFLVPSREGRKVLGTLWDTSIFPDRAPQGHIMLRSMVGGARASDLALLSEDRIVDLVREELKTIMGIDALPDFVRVYRHEKAIPQYLRGHAEGLAAIQKELAGMRGLYITGNAMRGVALNDCVTNAFLSSRNIVSDLMA